MAAGYDGLTQMAALESEDFQEDEVWSNMKTSSECSSSRKNPSISSSSSAPRRLIMAATQRGIPRTAGGGLQELPGFIPLRRSSVPVNIPNWSKILKKQGPTRNPWDDACSDDDNGGTGGGRRHFHYMEDDNDDGDMVPPHEYLARRNAGSQVASFSMCEGIGRTLKGRDLRNLRNAILSKTGFLE